MTRSWFALALVLPVAAWSAGTPQPQPQPQAAWQGKASAHKPLFTMRFVLLPAPRTPSTPPRIDVDKRAAVIAPLHWDARDSVRLRPLAWRPNVEICRGWACDVPVPH